MPNRRTPLILDLVFQALADPTRRAVLQRLGKGPASVGELAKPFAMALPSFMQHLKVLEDSGLVHSEKKGRVRTCHLKTERMAEAEAWMTQQRTIWEARFDRLDHYLREIQDKETEETPPKQKGDPS